MIYTSVSSTAYKQGVKLSESSRNQRGFCISAAGHTHIERAVFRLKILMLGTKLS